MIRAGDGEEVGCTMASAKENDRCTVTFKVSGMHADWPVKGWEKVIGLDLS